MDIIEFAMQMELDGKEFYERSAESVSEPALKEILTYLAEEEQRHYEIFKHLSGGNTRRARKELNGKNSTMSTIKNVFVQLMDDDPAHDFGIDARSIWSEALKLEVSAERMYRDEANKEKNSERKNLLNSIADEERSHVYLIDNMLSFLADPQSFVVSQDYSAFKSWEGR